MEVVEVEEVAWSVCPRWRQGGQVLTVEATRERWIVVGEQNSGQASRPVLITTILQHLTLLPSVDNNILQHFLTLLPSVDSNNTTTTLNTYLVSSVNNNNNATTLNTYLADETSNSNTIYHGGTGHQYNTNNPLGSGLMVSPLSNSL